MWKFVSKLLIVICMFICINGCQKEFYSSTTIYYENNSGHDIVIVKTVKPSVDAILIPSEGSYIESGSEMGDDYIAPFDGSPIDIIFDNNRIITYNPKDATVFNTPFNFDNYEITIVKEEKWSKEYECRYTFLPEQYEMAEPYEPEE